MRAPLLASAFAALFALVVGCPPENYPDIVPPYLTDDVTPIVNDDTRTPNEKRVALAELGLSPSTINAILRSVRLGNQYGGTLRTAYDKVVAPNFLLLTPDEVQIYSDTATEVSDAISVTWNDEQAQAIVSYFDSYDLATPDELQAALDDNPDAVPAVVTASDLQSVFVDFDPALVLPELP